MRKYHDSCILLGSLVIFCSFLPAFTHSERLLGKAWRWAIYILDKASERPANGVRGFVFPWRVSFRGVSKVAQKRIPGWWFRKFQICFIFTLTWVKFDSYFSDGLKPPTRLGFVQGDILPCSLTKKAPEKWWLVGRRILFVFGFRELFRGELLNFRGGGYVFF